MSTRTKGGAPSVPPALVHLRDGDATTVKPLVAKLMTDRELRTLPLGRLFPEVKTIETSVLEVGLSRQAASAIRRAGIHRFAELGDQSPASLPEIFGLDPPGVAEILSLVIRGWAGEILGRNDLPRPSWVPAAPEKGGDLESAFAALERIPDFDLFCRHRLAEDKLSLRKLGADLGISGERVRQREKRVRREIEARLRAEGRPLGAAVRALVERLGALARRETLEAVLTQFDPGGRVQGGGAERLALLLYLMDFEVRGEWVQRAGVDRQTVEELGRLTAAGPVGFDDCRWMLSRLGIAEDLQRPWVEAQRGYLFVGGRLARESQVMEVPVAILRDVEEPLDLHDLFARTDPPMSFETFKSHVREDDRFRCRGPGRFGLDEWDEEAYSTLAEEMGEEIGRNGGSMRFAELVEAMRERFGATEAAVRYRARMPQFEVDADGHICRRVAPLVVPPKPLALTHGCFHLETGWATKMKVTPSLLRGTTTRIPLAFARKLGLQFGIFQEFVSPAGTLSVHWARQAASAAQLSCMRASVTWLNASEGDRLFLIHLGQDRLDFKLVRKQWIDEAAGAARLALECGCEADADPLSQVLTALGFDSNLPDAKRAIRGRLRERR